MAWKVEDKNRMDEPNASPTETNAQNAEPPAPEVLTPRTEADAEVATDDKPSNEATKTPIKSGRRKVYRPSHRGTFIGIAVVVAVLMVNAAIVAFVLKSQSKNGGLLGSQGEVTINQGVLDRIGVNRSVNGSSGLELVVSLTEGGHSAMIAIPGQTESESSAFRLAFKHFQRVDGTFRVSPKAKVGSVQIRVYESGFAEPKVTQSVTLD